MAITVRSIIFGKSDRDDLFAGNNEIIEVYCVTTSEIVASAFKDIVGDIRIDSKRNLISSLHIIGVECVDERLENHCFLGVLLKVCRSI